METLILSIIVLILSIYALVRSYKTMKFIEQIAERQKRFAQLDRQFWIAFENKDMKEARQILTEKKILLEKEIV